MKYILLLKSTKLGTINFYCHQQIKFHLPNQVCCRFHRAEHSLGKNEAGCMKDNLVCHRIYRTVQEFAFFPLQFCTWIIDSFLLFSHLHAPSFQFRHSFFLFFFLNQKFSDNFIFRQTSTFSLYYNLEFLISPFSL